MEVLELKTANEQKEWSDKIRNCDWGAAKLLADLVEQEKEMRMTLETCFLKNI